MSLININLPVTVKSENSKVIVQSPDVDTVHTTIEPNNIIIKGPDASQGISSTTTLIGGKISGLNAPTDDSDAANKKYVDDAVAGGGGGVTFLGEGGTTNAHFFAFDLGSAVMLVGRFLSALFGPSTEFTVGIDLGVSPSSFNAMIPITYYNSTSSGSSGTILTLSGSGANTIVKCASSTTTYGGNGCFTAIFVK
jgi:hypothetical protein